MRTYPPHEGYTADEIRRGWHWVHTDVTCEACGKVQPVAATHYVGGPCVQCGEPTIGGHRARENIASRATVSDAGESK